MQTFKVTYRIAGSTGSAKAIAEAVLLEQTIETPTSVAERYPFVRNQMMGRVLQIVPTQDGDHLATLSLPVRGVEGDPAQFLNVLFGNSSLHAHVSLVDFEVAPDVVRFLSGPSYGIEGIRRRTGVTGRPLTCSALKPIGLSVAELSATFGTFAEAGIDIIKDDHYLADQSFAPFEKRVRACQNIADEVSAGSGHQITYVPSLSGTPDTLRRQAELAQQIGVRAVMLAPMLIGLPVFHWLCRTELDVPVLAHPSFSGTRNIRPATLFGKLFRLFGADAVIFANYGGRFSFPAAQCAEIASTLRSEWIDVKPAFPVPAGGMDAERAFELVEFFGLDTILLVGGSLLVAGEHLGAKTRRFVEEVHEAAMILQNSVH